MLSLSGSGFPVPGLAEARCVFTSAHSPLELSTPLFTVTAHWALLYSGNRTGQDLYSKYVAPDDGTWMWQRSFIGGWTAGIFCSFLYTPVQAVKNTVQVHRCSNLEAVRKLWEFGGLRG